MKIGIKFPKKSEKKDEKEKMKAMIITKGKDCL
jgi:hypothetical protein